MSLSLAAAINTSIPSSASSSPAETRPIRSDTLPPNPTASGHETQQQPTGTTETTGTTGTSTTATNTSAAAAVAVDHLQNPTVPNRRPDLSPCAETEDYSDAEDIEMENMTPRRRSSLVSPALGGPSSRRRSPRARDLANGLDEQKISEEDSARLPSGPDDTDDDDLWDEDLHDDEEAGLTGADKRRKRRKRNRNTQLDQRIVRGDRISAEEKKEADKSVFRRLLVNGTLILLWYFFSLSISLYNKWMFDPAKLDFAFPLFTTATHMFVQFALASLVLYLVPSLRPQNAYRPDMGQSRHEPERPLMTKLFYLTRIGPCGVATGLDIGLGNTSLQFITLTFYTMCKSSSLAFVLIFAFLFRLETPTWKLVAIIATMTFGVVMMVAGEVEFKLGGFLLVISAAFFSGFRWGLTQILLLRNPATSNPFSSIFFLAPVMFLTLIVIAIPVEGFGPLIAGLKAIAEERGALVAPLLILFPGTIAFLMTASEFALLQRTSVVTLSIAGIFKEAVTISAAALVFGDTMTPINIVGLFVTLGAIVAYNWIKIHKMRKEALTDVHRAHAGATATVGGAGLPSPSTTGSGSRSGSDAGGDDDGAREDAGLLQQGVDGDDLNARVEHQPPPLGAGQRPEQRAATRGG
ncbi:triose-phosphate transporter family-domain-containing protein [Bombardia bombarda]|uniref:Triose-phosphate transporter family-domain-containing protein n=1 Tax=Bombardia bombarda TaxID=252184 RepID=A0AA39XB07_9PEZI|nr:triose-phosphate transporter family-domain-containing protein [Bombardia bombarda]